MLSFIYAVNQNATLNTVHSPMQVTTPAGCTIAGLLTMEDGKIRSTLARTIQEATKVASTLGSNQAKQQSDDNLHTWQRVSDGVDRRTINSPIKLKNVQPKKRNNISEKMKQLHQNESKSQIFKLCQNLLLFCDTVLLIIKYTH